jgi:CrcB protein
VAAGGATGAGARWAVLAVLPAGRFPWPVLAINVLGSFLLGALVAQRWTAPQQRLLLHDAAGIGFCGGFTTMSTFAVQVADLLGDGATATATAYAVASFAGGLLAAVAGAAGRRRGGAAAWPPGELP